MRLVDVYDSPGYSSSDCRQVLWDLLAERTPEQSISHKWMPTPEEHEAFVKSRPYLAWYLIEVHGCIRGACYLSKQREIGVAVLKDFRGSGFGHRAVQLLMGRHPGKFLANVNPANIPSANLFKSLGFGLIQHTYAHG
jgi:RimJ/RimL family protein N-acetyltransferase